jgi:hypothetical protein
LQGMAQDFLAEVRCSIVILYISTEQQRSVVETLSCGEPV